MKVRAPLYVVCAAILLAVGGCDGGTLTHASDGDAPGSHDKPDSGSEPSGGDVGSVLIVGPPVVTLSPSDTLRLLATIRSSSGEISSQARWSSEDRERVGVDAEGLLRAGDRPGHSWVFVEFGPLRDSVGVWVQPPESATSTFVITLHYGEGVPAWWRPAFEAAARRWERAIRAPLPPVAVAERRNHCEYLLSQPSDLRAGVETGVRIFVRVSDSLPPGGTPRATGGVCVNRGLPHPTSVVALVSLNAHALGDGPPPDLAYLTHHEVGHALGLVGALVGEQPTWQGPVQGNYQGHLARFGRSLDGHLMPAAIELDGYAHWPFADLMGTTRASAISHATIGALMDLGYPAAWYGSGPIEE